MKTICKLAKISLAVTILSGCATNTGNVSTDRRGRVTNAILTELGKAVGSVALATLQNAADASMDGQKIDLANGLTVALWSRMGTIINDGSIENIFNAWTGGDLLPIQDIAIQKVQEIQKTTGPFTKTESSLVLNTIASTISKEANK